jgi:hypothetical protein
MLPRLEKDREILAAMKRDLITCEAEISAQHQAAKSEKESKAE